MGRRARSPGAGRPAKLRQEGGARTAPDAIGHHDLVRGDRPPAPMDGASALAPSKQATDPRRNRKTRQSRRDPDPCGFPADPGRGGPEGILALGTDGHTSSLANRGRQASAGRSAAAPKMNDLGFIRRKAVALARRHRHRPAGAPRQINGVCGGSGPASAPMRPPAGPGPAPRLARRGIAGRGCVRDRRWRREWLESDVSPGAARRFAPT